MIATMSRILSPQIFLLLLLFLCANESNALSRDGEPKIRSEEAEKQELFENHVTMLDLSSPVVPGLSIRGEISSSFLKL